MFNDKAYLKGEIPHRLQETFEYKFNRAQKAFKK